jgi:type II secretory pathway pseudopilin PulG
MPPSSALPSSHRRGITLLEVLIAMFVLAVGILSIFALFTAGRELESRATIKSSAMAFAATQGATIGRQWLDWQQWLRVANPTDSTFRWAKPDPASGGPLPIVLPVIVDPWGLCSDVDVRHKDDADNPAPGSAWESAPDPDDLFWDWSRFVPLTSAAAGSAGVNEPFQRVTLPESVRTNMAVDAPLISPLPRESVLLTLSDKDAIAYRLSPNPNESPFNAFEAGQRKRGSDLVPALFIAAVNPGTNNVASSTSVKRSLLIFHKPVPDFESSKSQDVATTSGTKYWPSGVVELRVTQHENGLIRATLTTEPNDRTVVRRSLRPGKWVLFTSRLPRSTTAGPYHYATEWHELMSVTEDDDKEWLIVPKTDLDQDWPRTPETRRLTPLQPPITSWDTSYPDPDPSIEPALYSPIYCYGFEHLVHVEELTPETLP